MQESTSEQLKQKYIRPYSFSYRTLYKESWQLTKGAKGALLLGDFFYTLVILSGILLRYLIAHVSHPNVGFISQIIFILIVAKPLLCGLWLIAMQRAAGNKIKGTAIFSAINGFNIKQIFIITLYLVGLALVMAIPVIVFSVVGSSFFVKASIIQSYVSIGVIALYFCGLIYLMVIYSLALPLIASQRISGLQAFSLARLAIKQHFFKILFLLLFNFLILAVLGIFSLGIALIWVIPWLLIVRGRLINTLYALPQAEIA